MKTCFKCGLAKPLEQFYRHEMMGDGYLNKCKECTRADVRTNRANRREQYSRYELSRSKTRRRAQQQVRASRKSRRVNKAKWAARRAVAYALSAGTLTRKPCAFCANPKVQAHHDDYTKKLDVVWVCFKCHREKFHGQVVVSPSQERQKVVGG